jgi:hypothetical protein
MDDFISVSFLSLIVTTILYLQTVDFQGVVCFSF